MAKKKTTVSLVLGSGGARGLAHIGVIGWLNEHHFDIRSIAGSSMGALIGGIYAAGKLDVYAAWVCALERRDVIRLLDLSFSREGLFKGERVMTVLKDLIGDRRIEDLPISFTAVATDVNEEKEIWINQGSLFEAIRASIAIPTLFTPCDIMGRRLLDGGIVNPIPIAPTLNDNNDLTIAVNLSGKSTSLREDKGREASPKKTERSYRERILKFLESYHPLAPHDDEEEEEEMDLFDIVSKSMDTMQNTIARLKLAAYSPDVIIEIPKNVCTFYEFDRARELIALGTRKAEEYLGPLSRQSD